LKPVTLYTKPGCQGCRLTAKRFEINQTEYRTVDVDKDPVARKRIEDWGYKGVPVIETASGRTWYGYSPERIDALSKPAEQPVKELKRDAVVQDRDVVEDKG
jgi:glutaredoxin-like protein NrdH